MKLIIAVMASLPALIATAMPTEKRAGGPVSKPIPSDCTIMNPLPHSSDSCSTSSPISGYKPYANVTSAHQIYESYFTATLNQTAQAEQCIQQCYGYGNPGDCKSALVGYNVPTPKGFFGTEGGDLETACLLYNANLTPLDFESAMQGQWVNETAGSIYCPS